MAGINRHAPGCGCCGPETCDDPAVCVHVHCCGTDVEGATVRIYDDTDTLVDECTTDADGLCCVAVPEDGTYSYEAEKELLGLATGDLEAGCDGSSSPPADISMPTRLVVTVRSCDGTEDVGGLVAGADVVITGDYSASGVTDGNGQVVFDITPPDPCVDQDIHVEVSADDYITDDFDYTVTFCEGLLEANSLLLPDADHVCCNCADPSPLTSSFYPRTLFYSDAFGSCTLTYDGGGGGTNCSWSGSYTFSPATSRNFNAFACDGGPVSVTVFVYLKPRSSDWNFVLTKRALVCTAGVPPTQSCHLSNGGGANAVATGLVSGMCLDLPISGSGTATIVGGPTGGHFAPNQGCLGAAGAPSDFTGAFTITD
jgi:hypothetical protein